MQMFLKFADSKKNLPAKASKTDREIQLKKSLQIQIHPKLSEPSKSKPQTSRISGFLPPQFSIPAQIGLMKIRPKGRIKKKRCFICSEEMMTFSIECMGQLSDLGSNRSVL